MKSGDSNQLFDYIGLLEISAEIERLFPGAKNWFSFAPQYLSCKLNRDSVEILTV